ncbi:hypothetical protein EC973_001071 [Apophysomyces ossiformis]|uniref:CCHC-type domain-containing protein n=1 Tax=Apophysomyces ossiformis TaxID=679940 RepID=A0A8H7BQJ4_9FUNG|nr:hypothetical protein EC973_001071 [Apophysomyces ossiformis]
MSIRNPGGPTSGNGGSQLWSSVAAMGLRNVVPNVLNRKDQFGARERLETEIVWEEPEIAQKLLAQRATNILQNALFPNTVLFQFRAEDFTHHTDAYKLLEEKIGKIAGARPITKFGIQQRKDLIVEAKFASSMDTAKAITEAVHPMMIIRLSLSQLPPFATREELTVGLRTVLRAYGRLCQIKRCTNRGYFEGEAIVLLDTSPIDEVAWQPLERRLYLDVWDIFVPASFRGAPPICFACCQSGHIRRACPMLANITCFKCQGKGHIARRCRKEPVSDAEALDAYLEMSQEAESKSTHQMLEVAETTKVMSKKRGLDNEDMEYIVDMEDEEKVDEENMDEENADEGNLDKENMENILDEENNMKIHKNKVTEEEMTDAERREERDFLNTKDKYSIHKADLKVYKRKGIKGSQKLPSTDYKVSLQQKRTLSHKKQEGSNVTNKATVDLNNSPKLPTSDYMLSGPMANE